MNSKASELASPSPQRSIRAENTERTRVRILDAVVELVWCAGGVQVIP